MKQIGTKEVSNIIGCGFSTAKKYAKQCGAKLISHRYIWNKTNVDRLKEILKGFIIKE